MSNFPNKSAYEAMGINIPVMDLKANPWSEDNGGRAAQISYWRDEFNIGGEGYAGEREEFEAYITEHGLEN